MKLNIANPSTGCQKLYEIEDEKKLRTLYDKRLATEVDGSDLGEEFAGDGTDLASATPDYPPAVCSDNVSAIDHDPAPTLRQC